jgi:hypothetical protein
MPPAEPASVTFSRLMTQTLPILIMLGSILLLVGMILLHVADPGEDITKAGLALFDVGLFLVAMPLLIAGVSGESQNPNVRVALIIAAAIILYGWMRIAVNPFAAFF